MSTPDPDICPFCLQYEGRSVAQGDGVRYCPVCGADWQAIDVEVPPRISAELPALYDEPPPPAPSGVAPMTIGLILGLVGTLGVALVLQSMAEPDLAPASAAPGSGAASVAAAAPTQAAPATQAAPVTQAAPATAAPHPRLPSPPESSGRRAEAVQAALAALRPGLPGAAVLELQVEVEGAIAFLKGRVDSKATLDQAAAAAGQVFGVKAVDTRGVTQMFREYTVQPGDTLITLARRFYGSGAQWKRIWRANQHLNRDNPADLDVGTVIRLPTE